MGGANSRQTQLDKYGHLLSASEKEALSRCYEALTGSITVESFPEESLKSYLEGSRLSLPPDIVAGIYRALLNDSEPLVTFTGFIQNVSWLLRGSVSQKSQLFAQICSASPTPSIGEVEEAILMLLRAAFASDIVLSHLTHVKHWEHSIKGLQRLVSFLVKPLAVKRAAGSSRVTLGDLEQWLDSCSVLLKVMDIVFVFCFLREEVLTEEGSMNYLGIDSGTGHPSAERSLIPVKTQHPIVREKFDSRLLDHGALVVLNSFLPSSLRGKLYPLFSSVHHGESFSTFCKRLLNGGPTMIVVKDKGGHIFGGFASTSWQLHPQFTGDSNCFLFTLSPDIGVFSPTGYNSNFMYLQQNAQTLPNGLGMGGQMEYFGLWLSADYGTGHSKAKPKCSTYGSPMLSSSEDFQVDMLEVWGVGEPVLPDTEGEAGAATSILDKDKTATALLEMAGKTLHSKELRKPEEGDS